jgi:hypothetical protein
VLAALRMPHFADFHTSCPVRWTPKRVRGAFRVVCDEGRQSVRTERRDDLLTGRSGAYEVASRHRFAGQEGAVRAVHGDGAHIAGERAQIGDRLVGRQGGHLIAPPEWARMPLSRIAWLTTVALAVLTGIVLLIDNYTGYGVLAFVVGAAAAINLR